MVTSVTINPFAHNAGNAGLFNVTSKGFRQGTAMADPSTRYRLRQGLLATTETIPMWGGVGIYEFIPSPGTNYVGHPGGPPTARPGCSSPGAATSPTPP